MLVGQIMSFLLPCQVLRQLVAYNALLPDPLGVVFDTASCKTLSSRLPWSRQPSAAWNALPSDFLTRTGFGVLTRPVAWCASPPLDVFPQGFSITGIRCSMV